MKVRNLLFAFMLGSTFAATGCFIGDDDDDDDSVLVDGDACTKDCDESHGQCTLDCGDDACVAKCDSDLEDCEADCD